MSLEAGDFERVMSESPEKPTDSHLRDAIKRVFAVQEERIAQYQELRRYDIYNSNIINVYMYL